MILRDNESRTLRISTQTFIQHVFILFLTVELIVVLLDLLVYWGEIIPNQDIRRIFNITREDSPVTWVSTILFLSNAAVMYLIAIDASNWWRKIDWFIFSAFFTYLSLDDCAEIHEKLGTALGNYIEHYHIIHDSSPIIKLVHAYPSYYWQIIFVPVLAIMGMALLAIFWRDLTQKPYRLLLLAAFMVLGFSQILDYLEGLDHGYWILKEAFGWEERTILHLSKVVEEFLEMFGLTLLLLVGLKRFFVNAQFVSLQLTGVENTIN